MLNILYSTRFFRETSGFCTKKDLALGIFTFWEGDHFVVEMNTLESTK